MGDRSLTRDLMHIVWLVTVKQPFRDPKRLGEPSNKGKVYLGRDIVAEINLTFLAQ